MFSFQFIQNKTKKYRCPYAASERDRFYLEGMQCCHENAAYLGNLITNKTQVERKRKILKIKKQRKKQTTLK